MGAKRVTDAARRLTEEERNDRAGEENDGRKRIS